MKLNRRTSNKEVLHFYFLVNLSDHLYEFAGRIVFDKVKSAFLSIFRIIIYKINNSKKKKDFVSIYRIVNIKYYS